MLLFIAAGCLLPKKKMDAPARPKPQRRSSVGMATVLDQNLVDDDVWTSSRVFSAIDTDNSGFLDVTELSLALTCASGRKVSVEEASKIVKKYDLNEDGKLSFDEFEKYCKAVKGGGKKFSLPSFTRKKKALRKQGVLGIHDDVLCSRQEILAKEMSKGGKKVSP